MHTENILIQKELLEDLKPKQMKYQKDIETYNKDKQRNEKKCGLKLDVLAYFVSLINSRPFLYNDDDDREKNYVRLNTQKMKKQYHDKYSKYIQFLLDNNFIEKARAYSTKEKKSTSYKIHHNYRLNELVEYQITDISFLKKLEKNKVILKAEEIDYCRYKRPHLINCFDVGFTIDAKVAYTEILKYKDIDYIKYTRLAHAILYFKFKVHNCSINPLTDNRLHTTISRSHKIIRGYIKYKGESIIGLDIKNSQVYFLCALLKAILYKEKGIEIIKRIKADTVLDDKIIFKLFQLDINREEIIQFVEKVLDNNIDFYSDFANKLDIKYNEKNEPFRKEFKIKKSNNYNTESENSPRKTVVYDSERKIAKRVIMEVFNTSIGCSIAEVHVFRKHYPSLTKILDCLKNYGIQIWRLLDHIEAYCLLDYAALKFHQKHPEKLITSIHDCLVTTESHISLLEEEIKCHLMEITTLRIEPKFEVEDWGG